MASRFWSSIWLGREGSAAGDFARFRMIPAARTAGGPREGAVAVALRMEPPALLISVLNQTVRPSYWAPWISTKCGLPCRARAPAMASISAQVLGGVGTRSLRYHRSWVLVLYGTAYSLPFQVEVCSGTRRVPSTALRFAVPVHSPIQRASANSAAQA